MVSARVFAAAALGLAASACSYSSTTQAVRPAPVAYVATAPVTTYPIVTYPVATTTTYVVPEPAPTVYPPATTSPAGVEAFRDEYGFRYDGQGNRLDRYGNIISPHSTQP